MQQLMVTNEVFNIINCLAIYYEKGPSGNVFLEKRNVLGPNFKASKDAQRTKKMNMN